MFDPVSPNSDWFATSDGLTTAECHELTTVATTLPGCWLAQEDRDDLGHRTMALVDPSDGENAPVILAWRQDGCLHLGIGLAETYLPLGTHADIPDMTSHINSTLARLAAVGRWMEVEFRPASVARLD